MKSIFTKLFLVSALSVTGISYAQYYPNDDYGNNYGYEYYYDDYNYPDEYYYEYPNDYYTNDLYRGYYNDYRNTIISINWDRFFVEFRLSPYQIREIRILNSRFSSYGNWQRYYRYNPDRWYYDRFIALERILGPRIYVVYYQRYYRNYNPIVYYQNYRVKHYRPTVYVTPRYRNVDVRTFKNDAYRTGGFRNNDRAYNDNRNFEKSRENSGFRSGSSDERPRDNRGFRSSDSRNDNDRNYGNQNQQPSRNEGFRSVSPQRSENQNRGNDAVRSGGFRGQGQENKVSESRSSGNNGRGNGNSNGNRGGGFR